MTDLIKRYFSNLFDLLGTEPKVNPENVAVIEEQEAEHGIIFPDAVKAWYSIDNWEGILTSYSNFEEMEALDTLTSYEVWSDIEKDEVESEEFQRIQQYNQWVKERKLLGILSEHQGMVQWYLFLNDKQGYEIKPYFEMSYASQLLSDFPNNFEELIYLNIWDSKINGNWERGYTVFFPLKEFKTEQISFLEKQFKTLASTDLTGYEKIGRAIFRYEQGSNMVSYWKQSTPELILYGETLEDYQQLLKLFISSSEFAELKIELEKELEEVSSP